MSVTFLLAALVLVAPLRLPYLPNYSRAIY